MLAFKPVLDHGCPRACNSHCLLALSLLPILFLIFVMTLQGSDHYSHSADEEIGSVRLGQTQLRNAKERKPNNWHWL